MIKPKVHEHEQQACVRLYQVFSKALGAPAQESNRT